MTNLQAAMKDKSAKTWKERTIMFKVGSPMKGCRNCGEVEESGTGRRRYLSGYQVFRAYKPWWSGWTWRCAECGATDLNCWEPDAAGTVEYMLGKEPIVGCRDAVFGRKKEMRKMLEADLPPKEKKSKAHVDKIKELEDELARLMAALKGKKV